MPEIGSVQIEITPKGIDKLRERLDKAQAGVRKLWHRKCECSCGCPISHPGRKPQCVLCLGGDHWTRITDLLDQVMNKEAS